MLYLWTISAILLGCIVFCPSRAAIAEEYRGAPILTVLPKDAIPAIDRPEFVSVAEAEKLMQADELVISLREGGSARAYSSWLLNHHEIVNDVVDGMPVAVTW
jgi:hypothetical protein